jgi:ornithine carbamoyltransferase
MSARHVLSVTDFGPSHLSHLVDRALGYAAGHYAEERPLAGKAVALYFQCSSTRTRTAFTLGAMRLGAHVISYGPHELQIVTGETLHDTARVLSGFLDVLIIRTNRTINEMRVLAEQSNMSVINAMSDNEHPSQAVADLVTMKEKFGRLEGLHVLYLGEGNNSAASLALAVAQTPGLRLTLVTPEGYGLPENQLETISRLCRENDSVVEHHHQLTKLPRNIDVVYTTRWQTMGEPKSDPHWEQKFRPYGVTSELMEAVSKKSGTIFMHDLPAVRGCDVQDEVLDGAQSWAFRQAYHKLSSAMAILQWCAAEKD